jgi:Raf kinase inhibitor-like YbhB/YbcL family protein
MRSLCVGAALALAGCSVGKAPDPEPVPDAKINVDAAATLDLRSDLGMSKVEIPIAHTCDGEDVSIPFQWGDAPPQAKQFALVVDDEVRPGMVFVHWLAWNLPASQHALERGIRPDEPGFVQGINDFGRLGWGGPCPPKGDAEHTYTARIFALDAELAVPPDADRRALYAAMEGHVVAYGEWKGRYSRRP